MHLPLAVSALSALTFLPSTQAAETVLGAYIFHRHGDRTSKSHPPVSLTNLGYHQVHSSGSYYRTRYLSSNSSSKILGINPTIVQLSQLSVTAPVDNVLQLSATGFMQGLYPPVGSAKVEVLANGTEIEAPLGGYQIVPVNVVDVGEGSEDRAWLQDATGCRNAKLSSNMYFESQEYRELVESSGGFYKGLVGVVQGTYGAEDVSFRNAYMSEFSASFMFMFFVWNADGWMPVYDLINTAVIHNKTIPDKELLTDEVITQARILADAQQWGLAWNSTNQNRGISGFQLAGEVVNFLESTIEAGRSGSTNHRLGIQFGAYATFLSLFGALGLEKENPHFRGIPDYASSIVFEVFTEREVDDGVFPQNDEDVLVRLLFKNGTASVDQPPRQVSLGSDAKTLTWDKFVSRLSDFAVRDQKMWCMMCGNGKQGMCAQYDIEAEIEEVEERKHMSPAVGGVIGALVTLGVVGVTLAGVMLLAGLRVVSKKAVMAGDRGGLEKRLSGES